MSAKPGNSQSQLLELFMDPNQTAWGPTRLGESFDCLKTLEEFFKFFKIIRHFFCSMLVVRMQVAPFTHKGSSRQIRVRWRIRKSALAFLKKLAVWTLQCLREVLSLMAENPHDGSWASWKTILLEMMEQTTVLPISAINSMNYLQLIIMHEVWLQYLDTLYPDFLPCHYYHTASFVAAWIADNVIVSWKYPLKSTYGTFFYMLPPVKCEGVYSSDRSLSDVPVPPSVTEGKLNQQAKQRWRLRRLADLWYLHIFTESTLAKKTRAFSLFFFCCVLTTV